MKMKDNKKLEEFLDTKVGELGKKYFERFVEEGKKIVENAKDEFSKIVEEDDDEPEVEDPLNIEDLYDRYDELTEVTVKRFNNILKSKGVNTDLYSLTEFDYKNKDIFGDPFLNCTIHGLLTRDHDADLLIKLLKISEKMCNAVDSGSFKLFKIQKVEGLLADDIWFKMTFVDENCYYGIMLSVINYGHDIESISIWNGAELMIGANTLFSCADVFNPSESGNTNYIYFNSSVMDDEKQSALELIGISNLECIKYRSEDDEIYDKLAEHMKSNRRRLSKNLKLLSDELNVD